MKFYRYQIEQHSHGGYDMDGNYVPSNFPPTITLKLIEYDLIKETPKGYWISQWKWFVTKKWISKTSKKRYAYPTKEEALINFIKRSEIRAKILKAQLNACKEGLNLANKLNEIDYKKIEIVLTRNDLLKSQYNKPFDEISREDFKLTKKEICEADSIIFHDGNEKKVLKQKY